MRLTDRIKKWIGSTMMIVSGCAPYSAALLTKDDTTAIGILAGGAAGFVIGGITYIKGYNACKTEELVEKISTEYRRTGAELTPEKLQRLRSNVRRAPINEQQELIERLGNDREPYDISKYLEA